MEGKNSLMDLTLWEQIELSAPDAIKLINLLFAGDR